MDRERLIEVLDGETHEDYRRTVEIAKRYNQVCTGKDADELLSQFNPSEDDQLWEQRKQLTQIVTPSICHTILSPLSEMTRVTPLHKGVFHRTQSTQDEIENLLQDYYGNTGVDGLLRDKLIMLEALDPNSFLIIREEPIISYSHQNVDFKYKNNELQYLVSRSPVYFEQNRACPDCNDPITDIRHYCRTCDKTGFLLPDMVQGWRYDIYEGNTLTIYEQIPYEPGNIGFTDTRYRPDQHRLFKIERYTLSTPFIPCFRTGTRPDGQTMGRTTVSIIEPAMPYLLKSIKTVSELDINVSLHAFLQKFEYEPACDDCLNGERTDGTKCETCKGTGYQQARSGQTAITLRMPDAPEDLMSLRDLSHYVELPIEVPKFLDELVNKYERKAVKAVYVTDTYERSDVTATATEKLLENQAKNNTLYPSGLNYSHAYRYVCTIVAFMNGYRDFTIRHELPRALIIQSREDLVNEMKTVREAGISGYFYEALEYNYAQILFADQPDELQRIRVKKKFNPFKGKTKDEIMMLIAGDFVDDETIILYTYFDRIFDELEEENENGWFYKFPYDEIKRLIDIKVKAINDTQGSSRTESQRNLGETGNPA